MLDKRPILVKSLTSLVGFMLGDILAQAIGGNPYRVMRTVRLTLFGIFMDGPIGEPPVRAVPHRSTGAHAEETGLVQGMSGTARWTNMCMRTSPRPRGRCWPRRPSTSSCGHHSSQPCSSPSCAAWRYILQTVWCQGLLGCLGLTVLIIVNCCSRDAQTRP